MSVPLLMVGNFLSSTRRYRLVGEELAAHLEQRGWTVLTTSDKPQRPLRLLDMVASAWRWRHRYTVAQVDVYSGSAFLWAEAACFTLRRAHKPYVLTLHGGELPSFARRRPRRVRALLRSAAAVTAPSSYLLQQLAPYRDGLQLLPNAIELGAYEFRLRRTVWPDLLWLRAFHAIYNPPLAVEVLARLERDVPACRLTMIGPERDDSLRRSRDAATRLGVTDRVTFVGGVAKSDVPQWMSRSDILINTTNADNTPISVLEAMASGLCVVSTAVGGIPYLLEDGTDALLVPPNDADAMAAAVHRILTEPGLAEQLSTNARAKAMRHDWSVVLPQWEDLLQRTAGGGNGPQR